jgi:fatty acid synthase, bacteria type
VRKLPGARLYLACRRPYRNRVAGMLPAGWHPSFFGFSEGEIADRDRNTLLMLTATAGAIRKLGRSMKELFRHVNPVRVGNSLGTGIGGMERLIRLYTDPVWNAKRDPISLQESLGNVGAGHVSQELLGNYGPMVSPVSACATAGVSVEIAWEKLKLGRADLMVAGAFDDISYAGTVGFDDMNATVDSAKLARQAIPPGRMSRPQDRRRHGFVESQGGGTLLLMRAGDAVRLGLPIHAVVGGAWSFGDGLHQSIPAPGFGALSVAQGREHSLLARALAEHGLGIDDVGAVSLHGTSTPVNDPHETGIFQDIFEHLGRTRGLPALAVSQKAVTGHTKGGASACQLIGVIQMMRDSVVPGHLNLDDLEEKQQKFHHLVFPARPLPVPAERLKAACVSTLGFGHVSSMVLVVNPSVLLSELAEDVRKEYLQRSASARRPHLDMETRLGLSPVVRLARGKGFATEEAEKRFLLEGGNHGE